MRELPADIYEAARVRELDRLAIEEVGIAGYTLMSRAGRAAFLAMRERWPDSGRVLVLCGSGNNGGDGYVLARHAIERGLHVTVAALTPPERLRGDAARAWSDFTASGARAIAWDERLLDEDCVVVDALLGTGLERPLEGDWRTAVERLNAARRPVLALDIPSGLHADTGEVLGTAVRAGTTMCFVGLKLGCFLGEGPEHTGELLFDDLDVPAPIYAQVPRALERLTVASLAGLLAPRRRGTHKGREGHVLVVGGGPGMGGSIRLTAEAALRAGAGLVTVATETRNAQLLTAARPELMASGVEDGGALAPLLERAGVVAIGPGLGRGDWGRSLWQAVLAAERPLIVDADALNLLAGQPRRRADWVLTPHPGEAARLLRSSAAEVQADRLAAVREIAGRYDGVAVLKGVCTLVSADGQETAVCDRGSPAMATAGSGDVLTGVLAGIAAAGRPLAAAARAAVLVHALAGEDAARDGERGTVAGDLFAHIRCRVNPVAR
ncbi:MAG TPA: NAD(P)H-hydrate dehydratase [Gammaproteobacteria bacterium]|nr:NAD(P)H-hydrate dehydratase [Gammaproteobacteria bacterium]